MRFLFTTNPMMGHWLPMLPLVRAAQRAGHEVVVATGPDLAIDVERLGLTSWSIGADLATIQTRHQARPVAAHESEMDRIIGSGLAMFAVPAVDRGRDLQRLAHDWAPDVVVSEIYELGGSWVPARLHVWHGLGAHYPNFVQLAQLCEGRVRTELGETARRTPLAETPYVDPFPPQLQPPADKPYADVIAMRPAAGEVTAGDVLPPSVQALPHERTVYLTLGTLFNEPEEFAAPLAALAELAVNVVVTTGYGTDPASLGPLPVNVAAERYIPQALLLPRCRAVVCHAGAGTVIGALAYGVPLVCLPRGADQYGNAEAVARVGAGLTLPPDRATAAEIRAATGQVLDEPTYSAEAANLRAVIERLPDPADVVTDLGERASGGDA